MPFEEPIVPIYGLLLLHVPEAEPSVKVVVNPTHAFNVPEIGCIAFTVAIVVVQQPVAIV
jgi:hypothetical protein